MSFPLEAGKTYYFKGSSYWTQNITLSLTLDQSGKNLLQNRDNHAYATFTAPAAGTYTFYSVVSEYMEFQNVYDENWVPLDEKDYSRPLRRKTSAIRFSPAAIVSDSETGPTM